MVGEDKEIDSKSFSLGDNLNERDQNRSALVLMALMAFALFLMVSAGNSHAPKTSAQQDEYPLFGGAPASAPVSQVPGKWAIDDPDQTAERHLPQGVIELPGQVGRSQHERLESQKPGKVSSDLMPPHASVSEAPGKAGSATEKHPM